ncbi:hypothetical protein TESG_06708 [Trichophyton tonsurans CBS 112818]|uniref:Uncharacterized protein n=1 Tax=Trichophyton tonsurans (strain CBS 112818) TaxID=647933 RepID=F2S705_TRIT1|nr:hypothetical protein TESG_06708 [Trichophyton tonsurans CBS 112818]
MRMRMNLHLLTERGRNYPYPLVIAGAGNTHWIFSVHPPYVHSEPLVTRGRDSSKSRLSVMISGQIVHRSYAGQKEVDECDVVAITFFSMHEGILAASKDKSRYRTLASSRPTWELGWVAQAGEPLYPEKKKQRREAAKKNQIASSKLADGAQREATFLIAAFVCSALISHRGRNMRQRRKEAEKTHHSRMGGENS